MWVSTLACAVEVDQKLPLTTALCFCSAVRQRRHSLHMEVSSVLCEMRKLFGLRVQTECLVQNLPPKRTLQNRSYSASVARCAIIKIHHFFFEIGVEAHARSQRRQHRFDRKLEGTRSRLFSEFSSNAGRIFRILQDFTCELSTKARLAWNRKFFS